MEAKRSYRFGAFRLEPAERRLLRDDQPVSLTPKCFDLLVVFVENSGHLLEKDELLKRLWPDQFVEESNLSFNVSSLRKVLGEGENGQRFIETVPKKGFRFVAPVEEYQNDSISLTTPTSVAGVEQHIRPSQPKSAEGLRPRSIIIFGLLSASALVLLAYGIWARRAVEVPGRKAPPRTIAVLPFKPLNTERRDETLENGMAEALITKLSNLNQLQVRPMSAVRKYTDLHQDPVKAGRELRTEAVLDGSIQKDGDRFRVSVRLTNVESGAALWAEQFDESFTNIFKVQDSISERVTEGLAIRLGLEDRARLTRHSTNNAEAYQLYLRGQYYFKKQTGDRADHLRKSLEYYEQAVEKDPKFALAFVGISEFYISGGNRKILTEERFLYAKAAVLKALELDNMLAEAYNALAELKYQYELDWTGAEANFKRAIDLKPNESYFHVAYSWFLMCQGLFDEAQSEFDKAQELEPGSLRLNKTQGIIFLFRRQYDRSIAHYQKLHEVEPELIHRNQWSMSAAYEQMGMHAQAVEEFCKDGRERKYLSPEDIAVLKKAFKTSGWNGYVRMRIDLLEEKAKKQYVSPTTLAGVHALAGEIEPAFAWLEKAIDAHDPWLSLIKIQPAYDNLRSDPRFAKMLQRVNLTP